MSYWLISSSINSLLNNLVITTVGAEGASAEDAYTENTLIKDICTRGSCSGSNCTKAGTSSGHLCI